MAYVPAIREPCAGGERAPLRERLRRHGRRADRPRLRARRPSRCRPDRRALRWCARAARRREADPPQHGRPHGPCPRGGGRGGSCGDRGAGADRRAAPAADALGRGPPIRRRRDRRAAVVGRRAGPRCRRRGRGRCRGSVARLRRRRPCGTDRGSVAPRAGPRRRARGAEGARGAQPRARRRRGPEGAVAARQAAGRRSRSRKRMRSPSRSRTRSGRPCPRSRACRPISSR